MAGRYTHWFWNSWAMTFVAVRLARFNNWLWYKRYGKKER